MKLSIISCENNNQNASPSAIFFIILFFDFCWFFFSCCTHRPWIVAVQLGIELVWSCYTRLKPQPGYADFYDAKGEVTCSQKGADIVFFWSVYDPNSDCLWHPWILELQRNVQDNVLFQETEFGFGSNFLTWIPDFCLFY